MTEMIIYDLFLFNLLLATVPAIIIAAASANRLRRFQPRLFSAPEIFVPDEKAAPKTGARK